MKTTAFLWISLIAAIAFCMVLLITRSVQPKELVLPKEELQEKQVLQAFGFTDFRIDSTRLNALDKEPVSWLELIRSPKLVFRFSETMCDVCYLMELEMLKNYASAIGIENIVVLTTFERDRDAKLFRDRNHIPYHFFNLPQGAIHADIENFGYPYLFVAMGDTAKYFFIPEKKAPGMSEEYYKRMCMLFRDKTAEQENATLIFNRKSFNLGTLKSKEKVKVPVFILNRSEKTWEITDVSSTCGCTAVSTGSKLVPPGKVGEIWITYSAKEPGVFLQKVALTSSNPNNTHYVVVKGVVE